MVKISNLMTKGNRSRSNSSKSKFRFNYTFLILWWLRKKATLGLREVTCVSTEEVSGTTGNPPRDPSFPAQGHTQRCSGSKSALGFGSGEVKGLTVISKRTREYSRAVAFHADAHCSSIPVHSYYCICLFTGCGTPTK